jgi:hypothetical protein
VTSRSVEPVSEALPAAVPKGLPADAEEVQLLSELRSAIRRSAVRPRKVEVGVVLSVALGRERGSVSCGGCQVPLEVDGVPAETVVHLRQPFRLVLDEPAGA